MAIDIAAIRKAASEFIPDRGTVLEVIQWLYSEAWILMGIDTIKEQYFAYHPTVTEARGDVLLLCNEIEERDKKIEQLGKEVREWRERAKLDIWADDYLQAKKKKPDEEPNYVTWSVEYDKETDRIINGPPEPKQTN